MSKAQAQTQSTESALITWVNDFPIDAQIKSLEDLNDGQVFSRLLGDLDPDYAPTFTTGSDELQIVVQALLRYIQDKCEDEDIKFLPNLPTLKAIANGGVQNYISEIVIGILLACISSPNKVHYIQAITALDASVQEKIVGLIQQKQNELKTLREDHANPTPLSPSNNIEFEFEERYSTLISKKKLLEQENEKLKKEMADEYTRIEKLQTHNDLLQEKLSETEQDLKTLTRDGDSANIIKNLEIKVREQDDIIANQEGQIEQDRIEKTRIRRDLDRLSSVKEANQQLEDELKELKHQNLELAKKANTVDRFKQKLENQKELEIYVKDVQLENEELKNQVIEYERLRHRNEQLEATHVQFQNTLSKREIEIFEMSNQKKFLEDDKVALERSVAILEERRTHDENFIADLQERLNGRHASGSPTSMTMPSLEEELEQSESAGPRNNLEISRLKAENQLLKGNAAAAAENGSLRAQLEEADKLRKDLEAKYRDIYEKHAIAQQQLTVVLEHSAAEGLVKAVNAAMLIGKFEVLTVEWYRSQALNQLRTAHQTASDELSAAQKKILELEAELESTKRELLEARTDLSMIEKEDIDALEELKATQESLTSSFETELKALKTRHKALQNDFDLQKSQLIEALLAKDKLRDLTSQKAVLDIDAKATVDDKKIKEFKEAEEQIEKKMREQEDDFWRNKMEVLEEVKVQKILIEELRARIKSLESGGPDPEKTELQKANSALRHENSMIVTAWYDLTNRLQSNSVVVQRRPDASRSWINKQRQAVNVVGRR